MMRRLIYVIVFLAVLFSLYWLAVARLVQSGADQAVSQLAQQGIDLRFAALNTAGYPMQFDSRAADVVIAQPQAGWQWQLPQLRMQAGSARPWDITLTLPAAQQIIVQGQTLQAASRDAAARVTLRPDPAFGLDRAALTFADAQVVSDAGWSLALAGLAAELAQVSQADAAYDASVRITDLDIPVGLRALLDPQGLLAQDAVQMRVAAQLRFAAPLDLRLQSAAQAVPDQIDLRDLTLDWGAIRAQLSGAISIDAAGWPSGQLVVQTAQWPVLLQLLTNAGVIDANMARNASRFAAFMVAADGTLTLPVLIQDGRIAVAGVPVMLAPRLR
jgi:hypothetical protein